MTSLVPATPTPTVSVVGKGIYLELSPVPNAEGEYGWKGKTARQQIFITPAAVSSSGRKIGMMIWHRLVAEYAPRSQWDWTVVEPTQSVEDLLIGAAGSEANYLYTQKFDPAEFESYPDELKAKLYANGAALHLRPRMLDYSVGYDEDKKPYREYRQSWEASTMFTFEVTTEDIEQIVFRKTPQAIIRRINKGRVAKGLPEKVVVAE